MNQILDFRVQFERIHHFDDYTGSLKAIKIRSSNYATPYLREGQTCVK